jgi:hypothetical protein
VRGITANAASDNPVASAISLSENASILGVISRLNRAQLRLRRCPALIASPRAVYCGTAPRIIARGSLFCEHFASRCDRSQSKAVRKLAKVAASRSRGRFRT